MIKESELILNPDGSIYHLNLLPEDIASTIITVGDPKRVARISAHFDVIEVKKEKREFVTHTGIYKGKRITVIATGIGPDNIDIVLNELDALVNIDFKTRKIKDELTSLNIIRIGTSGSLQADIPVDSFVLGKYGLGLDNMLRSYDLTGITETKIEEAFVQHTNWDLDKGKPTVIKGSEVLLNKIQSEKTFTGFTATAGGFYGPQGRVLRLPLQDAELNHKMDSFSFEGTKLTNLEMETSAIYGLSKMLGHEALSANAIIANRANQTFSKDPYKVVDELIEYVLFKLSL
ncbi:uridine phosphorylase [Pustulibacterium marinum]|uniref:Uridine phosphorylase n=1 Tax=Pustulibacterium marinum TaxID=1224947 RepID=A0A1I7IHB5_9FLAO|nr:nucleoside phosphorylase [Pustulibacterium marinum]SFU72311.1 uridine phosphorylase [Pustulibacterium marinum]